MAAPAARSASALRALSNAARRPQPQRALPSPRLLSSTPLARYTPPPPSYSPSSPSSSPSSSSSLPPRPSTAGTHLYAPRPASQHTFLSTLLTQLGPRALPNPDALDLRTAEKALTHKSGVDKGALYRRSTAGELDAHARSADEGGRIGHNEKLAFVGRRVLRLHLTQHLFTRLSSSHPALLAQALTAPSRSPLSLDALLDTKNLGAGVGRQWGVEGALRWREVRGHDGEVTGLYKCRGSAVEAVVGAVYTTQGIDASSHVFEHLVLPHLALPRSLSAALEGAPAPAPAPAQQVGGAQA
ncbi:hypothetical protein JCM3775_004698 [Rhodotorula graminis]|uniref:RNase III domain-containing protein n=1 Tax=Rhodotorula graminis (strain WP1) TaxID=578459 RepID=A0A0P9EWN4_RHOGW|nr:uncharacterized protein RHOBADRAFT_45685 [Rhodotorula graminis WP1]KPV73728.1 hypothetical protein RHOBADRAFT_45685 [Rhodotorula graminis WP1]